MAPAVVVGKSRVAGSLQCVLPAGPGEVGGARGLARCWKAVETFLAAGFILTLLVSPMAKSGD